MGCVTKYSKDQTTSVFVPCDCTSEILYIEYDHKHKIADLSIYSHPSYGISLSLWQKLRYIWQVLVHSKPYSDQMVLTDRQLKDLKRFLVEIDIK
jgi:hypothetical protein